MNNPKVALIQFSVGEDREDNLTRAYEKVKEAVENGSDIVVLPEMFYCPYQTSCFPIYAQERGGEIFNRLASWAKEFQIIFIAGSVPELEEGRVYNTAYCFNPQGELVGAHRKVHLFDIDVEGGQSFKESDTLTAGDCITVFDSPFGKIGVCVCYDFRFPEMARLMALAGVKMIIVPGAFNMTTGPAHWELLFRTRAMENTLYTIGVAPARDPEGSYVSYAHSMACSPWGEVLTDMGTAESTEYITLELENVTLIRSGLPLLAQRRTDLYMLGVRPDRRRS